MKNDLKTLRPLNFIILTVSGIINAIGVTLFLAPAALYDSGFSGTSMLIADRTGLSLSIFLVALNLPFFLLGLKKQGAAFTLYSLYAVAVYSVAAFIINDVLPFDNYTTSPLVGNDIFLSAAFGGLISGVGSGLTIRYGGAIDGVEVLAVLFAKRINLTVGSFIMVYNVFVYVLAGALSSSWVVPLYSIVAYAVGVKTVDFIVEGLDKAKAAFIITCEPERIASELSETFGRGVTMIDAEGFYSRRPMTMIYCVVNRFQIARLKRIVNDADPSAFVAVNEISDTLGNDLGLRPFFARKKKASTVPDVNAERAEEENLTE